MHLHGFKDENMLEHKIHARKQLVKTYNMLMCFLRSVSDCSCRMINIEQLYTLFKGKKKITFLVIKVKISTHENGCIFF